MQILNFFQLRVFFNPKSSSQIQLAFLIAEHFDTWWRFCVFIWNKYSAYNFKSVLTLMFVTHSHLKNEWPRGQNETIFFSRETNFVGIALHLFKFSDPQSWSNHRSGNLATAQTKVLFFLWSPVVIFCLSKIIEL